MLDIFWDLFQQGQINNLHQGRLGQLEKEKNQDSKAALLEERLQELEQRHEQLKLVTLAFWSLLRDHSGLLESDLRKYVEQIDLLDGKRDGKTARSLEKTTCTGCSRTVIGTSTVCVYCGTPIKRTGGLFSGT
jgi:type I site-specific restriction endonuclease